MDARATPNFDEPIERRGTHCSKWDGMEAATGVGARGGLAMWVADMEFRPPAPVQRAVEAMAAHGVYGYPLGAADPGYLAAIRWWLSARHGWEPAPEAILTTHGLVNGVGVVVDALTEPGDAVAIFTPVYHAFARVIRAAGREVRELPLARDGDRYAMDFDACEGLMTGRERMVILCSPHNPGGRVWTPGELAQVAAFARRHELVLVSDEIHCDLVMPGHRHTSMARVEGAERLILMTATTKTFNIAGAHLGNVIIPDPALRAPVERRMMAMGLSPNAFGIAMATAAYSPEGAAWVDALIPYLDANRRLLDRGLQAIPGVRPMPLEATYLAWVDLSGLGMPEAEVMRRIGGEARIGVNRGPSFGTGGEGFVRVNFAAPRAMVEEAVARLRAAFADVQ